MNTDLNESRLTTANLAAAAATPATQREVVLDPNEAAIRLPAVKPTSEAVTLAPLFLPEIATGFRTRWDAVQSSFVDDPKLAVRQGDELVAQVLKSLAETFAGERATLEGQVDATDKVSTEDLRVALQRYRSFFQRLLSL
jgi:hypothetical protein